MMLVHQRFNVNVSLQLAADVEDDLMGVEPQMHLDNGLELPRFGGQI
jgi:hypothetical protein